MMPGSRRDRSTQPIHKPESLSIRAEHASVVNAVAAANWALDTTKLITAGDCDLSLDSLISLCSQHLIAMETCVKSGAGGVLPCDKTILALQDLLKVYRAAAAEVGALGLDGGISHRRWQRDIKLPNEVTKARK